MDGGKARGGRGREEASGRHMSGSGWRFSDNVRGPGCVGWQSVLGSVCALHSLSGD